MNMSAKEDIQHGSQLTMAAHSLALTSEIFKTLVERGYCPHDTSHALDFMEGIQKASDGLRAMLEEHTAVLKAHLELDKM
jgi:hypothetical protein